jgi:hypothetical protein
VREKQGEILSQKKHPHARTVERFKYRNAAVMQGGILGLDKLVLITMCEFAHDDGILYHGLRSLEAATGLSKSAIGESVQRLCELHGVVSCIEKGSGKKHSSRYKILIDAMPEITVYDLVKAKNREENEKNAAQPPAGGTVDNRPPNGQLNDEASATRTVKTNRPPNGQLEGQPSARRTKDIDVASKMLTQVEGVHVNTLGTDAPHTLGTTEESQRQPRPGSSSNSKAKPDRVSCSRHPGREAVCYIRPDSIGDGLPRYACDECFRDHKFGYEQNRMTFRGTYSVFSKPTTVRCAEATPSFQCDDPSKDNYVRPL